MITIDNVKKPLCYKFISRPSIHRYLFILNVLNLVWNTWTYFKSLFDFLQSHRWAQGDGVNARKKPL